MTEQLVVLGAPDPEMQAIEGLLTAAGVPFVYATADSARVHPGNAYRADLFPGATHWVECAPAGEHFADWARTAGLVMIDHHRPGDPGYGRPPEEFLPASSIGQVIAELARLGRFPKVGVGRHDPPEAPGTFWPMDVAPFAWCVVVASRHGARPCDVVVPHELMLVAAADHCLAAAYQGRCPGVDPDELMRWRIESRAEYQGRDAAEVLADVERAREVLRAAPVLGPLGVKDMRGQHVPELPEASAREGMCFVADGLPSRDGRVKVVCQSGSPAQIRSFFIWAVRNGLQDTYGDPARGFAGAYLAQ